MFQFLCIIRIVVVDVSDVFWRIFWLIVGDADEMSILERRFELRGILPSRLFRVGHRLRYVLEELVYRGIRGGSHEPGEVSVIGSCGIHPRAQSRCERAGSLPRSRRPLETDDLCSALRNECSLLITRE
ncbi:hypothetical protein C475_22104 [Halosimplex carlsbadense 2-9-1]|uniref:Uncharacterized protein n=1 Tax=Halosimplex carlsbadense 2-9-1 TaxID=797114 RepID=M0CCR1_9EURY|nr:hypothetical protein C475_22104 [Halosimplex carlsbadense 2-9-1]